MSDALRRDDAIKARVGQKIAAKAGSHVWGHVQTLSEMVGGIVGSRHTQLPRIADAATCRGAQRESQIKRYTRWLHNQSIEYERYYSPFAAEVIERLSARGELILIIDGSPVGRGCQALMVSVVYETRALPLAWLVRAGTKGHFTQAQHCALIQQVQTLIPPQVQVTLLGDGEFDGGAWLVALEALGWSFVCRTAHNRHLTHPDLGTFRFNQIIMLPDQAFYATPVTLTHPQSGTYLALALWESGYAHPLFLLTNLPDSQAAAALYRLRFRIETFFADQKRRGFHLHLSHLASPSALARLLIPACLAYLWIVFLGSLASRPPWRSLLHRSHRSDLSLFQLGFTFLALCLKRDFPLLVAFSP